MSNTITLEDRIQQSSKIVTFLSEKSKELKTEDEVIHFIYNNAVEDVIDSIEVYADKNPQHRLAFVALMLEIESWMPLVVDPEDLDAFVRPDEA